MIDGLRYPLAIGFTHSRDARVLTMLLLGALLVPAAGCLGWAAGLLCMFAIVAGVWAAWPTGTVPELVINGADRTVRLPLTTGERVLLPSPQLYAIAAALSRSPAHGAADVTAWLHATAAAESGWVDHPARRATPVSTNAAGPARRRCESGGPVVSMDGQRLRSVKGWLLSWRARLLRSGSPASWAAPATSRSFPGQASRTTLGTP